MLNLISNKSPIRMLALFCLILFIISGCATTNPSVPEEVRKRIEHVAIIPAEFAPQMDYQPGHYFYGGRVSNIAQGTAVGATGFIVYGIAELQWIGVLLAPVFGVIGAVVVGHQASKDYVPDEVQDQIQEAIDSELVKLDIQKPMAEHLYRAGNDMTDYSYTIFSGIGPISQGQKPDYIALNLEGIDFILEVSVINLGFRGGKGPEPVIGLYMKVKVRAIDVKSAEELYSEMEEYTPEIHEWSDWMGNNDNYLHGWLMGCYHRLAKGFISQLFIIEP